MKRLPDIQLATFPTRTPAPCARAGFTIVEILIVVLLLGIMAFVVTPMIGDRADLRLASAARKVNADLQYAQALAISTQTPQYLRFNLNQYELLTRSGVTFIANTHPVDKNSFVVVFNNPSLNGDLAGLTLDAVLAGGSNIIMFDALGSPSSFDVATSSSTPLTTVTAITIRCGASSIQVNLEPYTGEITVSP